MEDNDNNNEDIGKQLSEVAVETSEGSKAITRSIHIVTRYGVTVTVTTQAEDEDIDKIRQIAEELIDKYKE